MYTTMFFYCSAFITLFSAVACQSVDETLKSTLNIEVDKNCVKEKISLDTYNALKEDIPLCSTDIFQKLSMDFDNKGSAKDVITSFCESTDKTLSCREAVADKLQPCLTDNQKNQLRYAVDAVEAIKRYACAHQDLLRESLKTDTTKCAKKDVMNQAEKCQEIATQLKNVTDDDKYKQESCLSAEMFMRCNADALRSCAGEAMYEVMLGIAYAGFNATPCKEYVNGSDQMLGLNVVLFAMFCLCCCIQKLLF